MEEKEFSINAKSCTLMYNSQNEGSTILERGIKFVIPIYQRPYSWSEREIEKLLKDIFASYWGNDELKIAVSDPLFIGTMQFSSLHETEQEIIDGQQRITTILLLLKVLRLKFPFSKELKIINLDLLKTEVNNGEQQKLLESAINLGSIENINHLNKYQENINVINNFLENILQNNEETFVIDHFVNYILSKLYFVVIETNAGLSKTLQIFNAINTTGLDLNGGDLFKIRMFEYLTDKKMEDKSVFNEISKLYEKIDQRNEATGKNYDISVMLNIYQYEIIAKYNLPTTLYYLGVDTFFERLFDSLLNINQWDNFKNNISNVQLSLDDIENIIVIRYDWEEKWISKENFTAEDACSLHLIWWSRYSRYWNLIFVFLKCYRGEENSWKKMLTFTKQLNKLCFIYSVRFQKIKSEIYYGLMQRIISSIVNNSHTETMKILNDAIGDIEKHSGDYDLNWFISEHLTENAKRKNLICRLSAMLEENYNTTDKIQVEEIQNKLFNSHLDIEHIQSYLDSNLEERLNIIQEWGSAINSLGNLMVLEENINRSISNSLYVEKISETRLVSYLSSTLQIVRNQAKNYKEWDLEKCNKRKHSETQKIINYLFDN